MDVRKTIAELTSELSEFNYESEEENILLKDLSNNDIVQSGVEDNDHDEVSPSKLRKSTATLILPEQVYGGKTTTRKNTYSVENDQGHNISDSESSVQNDEGSIEDVDDEEASDEDDNESHEEDLSETEDYSTVSKEIVQTNHDKGGTVDIYSARSRNVSNDMKKGTAIINQLKLWESLLECRIKLQKVLVLCKNIPRNAEGRQIKNKVRVGSECEQIERRGKCEKKLLFTLKSMIELYGDLLNLSSDNKKNKTVDLDEEIPSDESEIDNGNNDDDEDEEDGQPAKKKKKLNDYATLIKDNHEKFIPYRNAVIQKWNDKTKVSTGKMANSNFSAFDQSTLKQIEQILADKERLINRTRINRSECQTDGLKNEEEQMQVVPLDPEIFDDTDFYHKLLRDYIERKSVDAANSSHSERQMIELQKLRSKMKKNVDTRSTKGRKIRYVVLPKLVNFMAPDPYNTWSEQAETELYNSLFGKIKVSKN